VYIAGNTALALLLASRAARRHPALAVLEASAWRPALSALLAPSVGHRLLPDVVPAPSAPPDWKNAQLAPVLAFLDAELARGAFLYGAEPRSDLSVAGMTTYFRHAPGSLRARGATSRPGSRASRRSRRGRRARIRCGGDACVPTPDRGS
jgi:glutathione S-transferase